VNITIKVTNDPIMASTNDPANRFRIHRDGSISTTATSTRIAVAIRKVGHSLLLLSLQEINVGELSTFPRVANAIATPKLTVNEAYRPRPRNCDQVKPQFAVKPNPGDTTRDRYT
jgi:hypothetical protein